MHDFEFAMFIVASISLTLAVSLLTYGKEESE
jgi:hypothetical protein